MGERYLQRKINNRSYLVKICTPIESINEIKNLYDLIETKIIVTSYNKNSRIGRDIGPIIRNESTVISRPQKTISKPNF